MTTRLSSSLCQHHSPAPLGSDPRAARLRTVAWGSALVLGATLGACSVGGQTGDEFDKVMQRVQGDAVRLPSEGPKEGAASLELADFAWEFYGRVAEPDDNFVYSPYSLATAAAMLYAGADGETQSEMAEVFRFAEEGEAFHQARNDLLHFLDARNREADEDEGVQKQILKISNDFWMAQGFLPQPDFLNTLSAHYGAPVYLFEGSAEEVRAAINGKVARDTSDLIPELLPKGSIDEGTAFVLTNALYFKSAWQQPFPPRNTDPADFTLSGGEVVQLDMMFSSAARHGYAQVDEVEVLSMTYSGNELEFVAMMPPAGSFEDFVSGLSSVRVQELTGALEEEALSLHFPKMNVDFTLELKKELVNAGMVQAFDAEANFSPLSEEEVSLSDAFHQARLILDEEGTEAAAATAFTAGKGGAGTAVTEVSFNRPFVFFLRDIETQAVLFTGHFSKPD